MKLEPIEEMSPDRLLGIAQSQLRRIRGQNRAMLIGGQRTDDPNRPPPDPAVVQDLANLWRVVEQKCLRDKFRQAKTVALTSNELAAVKSVLGVR